MFRIFVFALMIMYCHLVLATDDVLTDDDSENSPLSQNCMRCLCKVMGCRKDEGCSNGVCGLFHITQGYWEAAHNSTSSPKNVAMYQECTNNVWCAMRTVQRHMRRYLPACEAKRPERPRCENAVALHKFGQRRCNRDLTTVIRTKLYSCLEKNVWEWLEDDRAWN